MNEIIDSIKREFPQLDVTIKRDDKFEIYCYTAYDTQTSDNINRLTFNWVDDKLYFIKEFTRFFVKSGNYGKYMEDYQHFNIDININHIVNIISLWIDNIDHTTHNCLNVLLQNPEFYYKSKLELCNDLIKLEFPHLDVDYHYNDTLSVNIDNDKYNLELKFEEKNDNIYLVEECTLFYIDDYVCSKDEVYDVKIEANEIVYLLNLWLNCGWREGGKKSIKELLNEHIGPKSARKV